MKRVAMLIAGIALAISAMAEASFDQIEGLIEQKNYAAAAAGLEGIIQNHPKSAKAFYAMAQAQAGLGNLEKAQKALNIATGLNPTLDFAPASSVQSLKDAITPQTAKIVAVEESHTMRNVMLLLLLGVTGFAIWYASQEMKRKREEDDAVAEAAAKRNAEWEAKRKQEHMDMLAKQDAERKAELAAEAALKAHKNYGHERFDPANPDKLKSVKQFKEEKLAEEMLAKARAEANEARLRAEAAEASARMYRTSAQAVQPTTTVVNSGSSSSDLAMGMMLGSMMSNNSHHHDTERTVVRETVREVPAPSRDSSWDDTPSRSSSRSSSWDDSSSSSKSSSSWSSSSDSSSSSSWDSGSSSSDSSSSSSSWD